MSTTKCDVAIVGAGPYGLSTAAHLQTIPGLEVRIFGEPMSFWNDHMPAGMLLRSNWTASQIACPRGELTLDAFEKQQQATVGTPVPIEKFVQYGLWYQNRAVPNVERQRVSRIERDHGRFLLTTRDGQSFESRRVVIACGIERFARWPSMFRQLPMELVSHASDHRDLTRFRGRQVLVVGSGQSALESAALLYEAGAEVTVVGRSDRIHWLQGRMSRLLHHELGDVIRSFLYAPTDVGPAGISQLLARPRVLQIMPRSLQNKLRRRATRPAGARWLLARLQDVPIQLGCHVLSVAPEGERIRVSLSTGRHLSFDHVLLATGYEIDISKYDFLTPDMLNQIHRVDGFPLLRSGLESSVPRLHFLGAPAAYSFGPLLQFVSGTRFAASSLIRAVQKVPAPAV